ncbi:uncharacterized protein TNCV_298501 [Trichonephila clavipes]|nr:uncharacterized protein TNCV_298501 [Trichonephila clavipes]
MVWKTFRYFLGVVRSAANDVFEQNVMSLLAVQIDLSGLLQNESRTGSTVFSIMKTQGYLPVRDTKVPVSFKVLSHWWIDFGVGGLIFHSVRTRSCTRVADLKNSLTKVRTKSFIVASTYLLMKSV